jgi:hypothetical protein
MYFVSCRVIAIKSLAQSTQHLRDEDIQSKGAPEGGNRIAEFEAITVRCSFETVIRLRRQCSPLLVLESDGYTPVPNMSIDLAIASPKSLRKAFCFPVTDDGKVPTMSSPLHIPIIFWSAGRISALSVFL